MPRKKKIGSPKMPDISNKVARRQFNVMNKVGQLGRQGVHGPVERLEKRLRGLKPKGT